MTKNLHSDLFQEIKVTVRCCLLKFWTASRVVDNSQDDGGGILHWEVTSWKVTAVQTEAAVPQVGPMIKRLQRK